MSKRNIKRIYEVLNTWCFNSREYGGSDNYDRIQDAIIKLCVVVTNTDTDEFIWCEVGEHYEACLGDFLVGAFWHFSQHHGGQDSKSYLTLCLISAIVSPGMTSTPEPDTGEETTFEFLNEIATT